MIHEFAAGGIVFKKEDNTIYILLAQHSFHKGWIFPKGIIGDKHDSESKEDTAIREVKEETGIEAEIIEPLTPRTFWYQMKGEKRKKTVYYYIMSHTGGNTEDHDFEMQAVEWIPIDKVIKRLTYKGDRTIFRTVEERIRELAK